MDQSLQDLQILQKGFIHKMEKLSKEVKSTFDFRMGNSNAFNDIIERFNSKIRLLLQNILTEAQKATLENIQLRTSYNNQHTIAETYNTSLVHVTNALTLATNNFNSLFKHTFDLANSCKELINRNKQLSVMQHENIDLKKKLENRECLLEKLYENFTTLASRQVSLEKLETFAQEVIPQVSDYAEIKAQNAELTKQLEVLSTNQDVNKLKSDLEEIENACTKYRNAAAHWLDQYKATKAQLDNANQTNEELKGQVSLLQQQIEMLKEMKNSSSSTNSEYEETIKSLKDELDSLRLQVDLMKEISATSSSTSNQYEETIKSLKNEIENMKNDHNEEIEQLHLLYRSRTSSEINPPPDIEAPCENEFDDTKDHVDEEQNQDDKPSDSEAVENVEIIPNEEENDSKSEEDNELDNAEEQDETIN